MTIPAATHWQPQGPGNRCVINGAEFGWLNCTPTSFAMAIERCTFQHAKPTGCDVRKQTHDTSGGTTLLQCADAAKVYGINAYVYLGNVTPHWVSLQVRAGKPIVLQGSTRPLLSTKFRSTGGAVNHAIYIHAVWGNNGRGDPQYAAVYDPAADGRNGGWGKASQGPQAWPWDLVLKFAAALQPWGEADPRVLGPGRFYVAVFPDTEPHVHLYGGATKSSPFPDAATGRKGSSSAARTIRKGPSDAYASAGTLAEGQAFIAFQWKQDVPQVRWYGNHDGNLWVRSTGLTGAGS